MKRRQFFPGKDHIHWCMSCNLPLIEDSCGVCGKTGKCITLSPPGDIRPASKAGVGLLKALFKKEFGTEAFLGGKMILLNKISGIDRTEHVIVDSFNIATISFSLEKLGYELELSLDGAILLGGLTDKKTVVLDGGKTTGRHLKGKKVNGEAVVEMSDDIKDGDSVIVKVGDSIGVGVALADKNSASPGQPAVRIRDLSFVRNIRFSDRKPGMEELTRANLPPLNKLEQKAVLEIKRAVSSVSGNLPLTVSFSGGKDSLVSLALASKVSNRFDVFFVDTGLEFPETVGYVKSFCANSGLTLYVASAGNTFWENVGRFGPPGKDYRWCCKTCKLAPLAELIEKRYRKGCITVEGNRKYESFSRSQTGLVSKNPFVPNQVTVNPIRDWRALEVWLYIHWRNLKYNPLYDEDFERIGCWLCPASLGSEFETLKVSHPQLRSRWEGYLKNWARSSSLDERYATHGFWRWKEHPPKMLELARKMGMNIVPARMPAAGLPSLSAAGGISPCIAGGYSIEAVMKSPFSPSLETIAGFMCMLGQTRASEEFDVVLVYLGKGNSVKLFAGGQFAITAGKKEMLPILLDSVLKQLLRAHLCTSCGICARTCPQKAISIRERVTVDMAKCTRCMKCANGCVVAKYSGKMVRGIKLG